MKTILPFYEREHGNISVLIREFAEQYPQLASSMGFVDGACEDPNVQRIIEAMVMLGARILQQLEDSYPQFTGALLGLNFPHYTQPFPSISIARFDYSGADLRTMNAVTKVSRGSVMHCNEHKGVICNFRTAYPVTIAPLVISEVTFIPLHSLPPGVRIPEGVTSTLRIVIEGTCETFRLSQLGLAELRVLIDGEPSLCATLRDILLMHTRCAFVEIGGTGRWIALAKVPIKAAGFDEDDALVPFTAGSHPAHRVLMEYLSFPEKFNFVDIDMAALIVHLPSGCQRLVLHLAVAGVAADSDNARILHRLSCKNLVLACTPIVNLFRRAAAPIELTHTKVEYPLLASAEQAAACDIYSVDAVRIIHATAAGDVTTECHPYFSLRHGMAEGRKGKYWTARRDEVLVQTNPGLEWRIALVNIDLDPLALETAALSIDLTCTNRDVPSTLGVGAPRGDLKLEGSGNGHPIRLLRKPTPSYRFAANAHWRLLSQLALNHRSLVQENLEAFTEMLALYCLPQSAASLRQIRGIVGIAHKSARAWIKDQYGGARVHGVEVIITLDEDAFVGRSIHAFIQVIDHFLALYVHLNTFTQLTVVSKTTGQELIRCLPRSGDFNLV